LIILLNEKERKKTKTFKKEVNDTQLYDITKQSEDIDEINREMDVYHHPQYNKKEASITNRKKRGKHAQQSRIVFFFSFRREREQNR